MGVPILFFFTGLHDDYHRTTDELALINRAGMRVIGSLVLDLAKRLGDGSPIPSTRRPR